MRSMITRAIWALGLAALLPACQSTQPDQDGLRATAPASPSTPNLEYHSSERSKIEKRNSALRQAANKCTLDAAGKYAIATPEPAAVIAAAAWDKCSVEWNAFYASIGDMKWNAGHRSSMDERDRVLKEVFGPTVMRFVLEVRTQIRLKQGTEPKPQSNPVPSMPGVAI